MKHFVDIENWDRKNNYEFFQTFATSWYAITTEIDCTQARIKAKENGHSLFLYYLYAVLRAANEVKELRYRVDKNGDVIYHDLVDIITPIAVPGKTFYTVRIPYASNFEQFYAAAHNIITNIPEDDDPYGAEKELVTKGVYDVMHLSAVPKLFFTSISFTVAEIGKGCNYPLMTAGKMVERENKLIMPLAIYVDHAFVDGAHLSDFFEKIQSYLNQ